MFCVAMSSVCLNGLFSLVRLTHFSPVSHFYTPWKCQKTFGFLTFSGGLKMWHWTKMGWKTRKSKIKWTAYSLFTGELISPKNVHKTYFGSLKLSHSNLEAITLYNSIAVFFLYFYLSNHEIYKPLWLWLLNFWIITNFWILLKTNIVFCVWKTTYWKSWTLSL